MGKGRNTILLALLLLLLLAAGGCKKRRPQVLVTVPPEIPVETQASQLPPEENTIPELEEPEEQEEPAAPAEEPKPKPRARRRRPAPAPAEAPAEANKRVVEEGGAPPAPVISAVIPDSTAVRTQQETAQLIASAESNLNGIRRSLNNSEQVMADQARNFIRQSQDATRSGDLVRAHNLAIKAHQLSSELAKN